jgi:hypothetical protein
MCNVAMTIINTYVSIGDHFLYAGYKIDHVFSIYISYNSKNGRNNRYYKMDSKYTQTY